MLGKNLPWKEKWWKIPLRFGLDGISAWKGLLSGDVDFFSAIAKAHFQVIFRWVCYKKPSQQALQPMRSLEGVYGGLIVWQYFVKHRHQFREIIGKKIL